MHLPARGFHSSLAPAICVVQNNWGGQLALPAPIYGYYSGWLADVRVWTVARVAATADWNTRLSGGEDNLLAYYRMREGSGTLLRDFTRFGRHRAMSLGDVFWDTGDLGATMCTPDCSINNGGCDALRSCTRAAALRSPRTHACAVLAFRQHDAGRTHLFLLSERLLDAG